MKRIMDEMNAFIDAELIDGQTDRAVSVQKFLQDVAKHAQVGEVAKFYTLNEGAVRNFEVYKVSDIDNDFASGDPVGGASYVYAGQTTCKGDVIVQEMSTGIQSSLAVNSFWIKCGDLIIVSGRGLSTCHKEMLGIPLLDEIKVSSDLVNGEAVIRIRRFNRVERELSNKKREMRKRIQKMKEIRLQKQSSERYKDMIDDISKCAQKAYPNRWQLLKLSDKLKLTIHFPNVTMTNSKNRVHEYKDMFVSFYVGLDGKLREGAYGQRGTLSLAEWMSNFLHPHLPFTRDLSESQFCMSDNNIEQLMTDLRRYSYYSSKKEYWLRRFTAVLFQMEAYVSWESLEGTRYSHTENISVRGREITIELDKEVKKLLRKVKEHPLAPPLRYIKGTGFQLASDTEEFEDWLVPMCTITQYRDEKNVFYVDTTEGIPTESFVVPGSHDVEFRGKTFKKTVIVPPQHEEKKEKGKKYCHRQIKDEFVKRINQLLAIEYRRKCVRKDFKSELDRAKKKTIYHTFNGKSQADNQSYSLLKAFEVVPDESGQRVERDTVLQD